MTRKLTKTARTAQQHPQPQSTATTAAVVVVVVAVVVVALLLLLLLRWLGCKCGWLVQLQTV